MSSYIIQYIYSGVDGAGSGILNLYLVVAICFLPSWDSPATLKYNIKHKIQTIIYLHIFRDRFLYINLYFFNILFIVRNNISNTLLFVPESLLFVSTSSFLWSLSLYILSLNLYLLSLNPQFLSLRLLFLSLLFVSKS